MTLAWMVSPEWTGQRCFIIAGGPSVLKQNTGALRGQKVIAVNSSWERVPFANYLIFGDARWWSEYGDAVRKARFAGRIVSCADHLHNATKVLRLKRTPEFSRDRASVMMRRTTLAAAINFAVHLGVSSIVLLGADGKVGKNGRTHHHRPHRWPQVRKCFRQQKDDLRRLVEPLQIIGVDICNASPGSALSDLWPIVDERSHPDIYRLLGK